jgi:hypothetical protein
MARTFFIVMNLGIAALITLGVFRGLPVRSLGVDGSALLLVVGFALSAIGLWRKTAWGLRCARLTSQVSLGLGLVSIVLLCMSISFLAGVNGAIGVGGVVLAVAVVALVAPYLIAFPLLQLWWLRRA